MGDVQQSLFEQPRAERPDISRRPSFEARMTLFAVCGQISPVVDEVGRGSLEHRIAEWFARRARAAFRHALWADDARYGGVEWRG